ncbi:agamous-like MADS-box protein AGL62 [Impatiens glandulifera]|uniref:agamous-like MADS-box protein AGL62 n=1 Tax=Impatiens glandulifera TaxID=253017 RepID=UPI001FB110FC|nr:agamous-like MADS-box protein AGL62 [Impatiens glandulifera]
MEKESNLQVTFSKRRTGVFKKCSELTTLCGVQMLTIVFSPGKKVFTFGHPSVDKIINRIMGTNDASSSMGLSRETQQLVESQQLSNVQDLNNQIMQVQEQLEVAKQRGKVIAEALQAGREQRWWERPMENMTYPQLEMVRGSLENMKALVDQKISEASNVNASISSINIPQSTRGVMGGPGPSSMGPHQAMGGSGNFGGGYY